MTLFRQKAVYTALTSMSRVTLLRCNIKLASIQHVTSTRYMLARPLFVLYSSLNYIILYYTLYEKVCVLRRTYLSCYTWDTCMLIFG